MNNKIIKATIDVNRNAKLILNRPLKKNALNLEMITTLKEILALWHQKQNINSLTICAEGNTFCAGADINWMKKASSFSYDENIQDALLLAEMLKLIYNFPAPVICVVQGSCYGGALGIVAASDIAICSTDANFCLSEVKLGLIPAIISPYIIQAIGPRQAKRYMLTAEIIDSIHAYSLGLIHEITSLTNLYTTANKFTHNFKSCSLTAQNQCKRLLNNILYKPISKEVINYTTKILAETRITGDCKEGINAFLEKRKPSWDKL